MNTCINREIASHIVKEIAPIVNLGLNIIDSIGVVLASTDPACVNTYHEGAYLMMEQGLDQLPVENNELYEGSTFGLNLPIHFGPEVVGVIGITGDPQEAMKCGRIVQKMAETIVYKHFSGVQNKVEELFGLLLVKDLVNGNLESDNLNVELFLKQFSIDIHLRFSVAVMSITFESKVIDNKLLWMKHDFIRRYVTEHFCSNSILAVYDDDSYILISNFSVEELGRYISAFGENLKNEYGAVLHCAIGRECASYTDIPEAYNNAVIIYKFSRGREAGVCTYDDLVLNLMISQIPFPYQRSLKDFVFRNCTEKEALDFSDFILDYFETNGSLNKLAEKYYMHKNTIQYKIQKIHRRTNFDMRIYHDLFVLFMAAFSLVSATRQPDTR